MRITTPAEIAELNKEVHDLWTDVTILAIGSDGTVDVQLLNDHRVPVGTLMVMHVVALRVDDSEGIAIYDINRLEYKANRLRIVMNIPATVEFNVSAFEISFEAYDRTPDS